MRILLLLLLLAAQAAALWKIGIFRVTMIAFFVDVLGLAAIFGAATLGSFEGGGITSKSPPWLLRVVGWCLLLGATLFLAGLAWKGWP